MENQLQTTQTLPMSMRQLWQTTPSNEVSVFATMPPATREDLAQWVGVIAVAFPRNTREFWQLVAKMAAKDRMPKQRLEFIADHLMHEQRYALQISDILGLDLRYRVYTGRELSAKYGCFPVEGFVVLKQRGEDGYIRLVSEEDAKRYRLETEPYGCTHG